MLIAERANRSTTSYAVGYYNRVAGPEETIQGSELLAAVELGTAKRPALVLNVESDNGAHLELIERIAPAEWRMVWRSANTGC
jgi:hypothetical protein